MDITTAKRILESAGLSLNRVDESKEDSRNLDSAYEIRPLVKGSEEAPEGFDQLYSIYWDEWSKLHDEGLIDYLDEPEELKPFHALSKLDSRHSDSDPVWVVKKLWYRVAEYMIDHDNEPCSAAEIKRGIGVEGYSQSFQKMRRDGFLQEVSKTKVVLSDWAAEKYYAAKEHAEEDRIAKERECISEYGTLEDQLKVHADYLARIKKAFADYRANYDQKLRDKRKADVTDYFDKRRTTTESINESLNVSAVGIRGEEPKRIKQIIRLSVDEYIRDLIERVELSDDGECVLVHFNTDGGNISSTDIKNELRSGARELGITLDFLKNSELQNYDSVDWWRD